MWMPFRRARPSPIFLLLIECVAPVTAQPLNQRVLVVYNTNFADSLTVANYYVAQRGIPAGNLCAISPPSSTQINATDYVNTVKTPIQSCLTNLPNGRTNILYIVFS